MAAKHNFATGDVLSYFETIKKQFHPELRDSIILVVWREDVDFGHYVLAEVLAPLHRFLTNCDAIINVHKVLWTESLNERQKAFHMDTALASLSRMDAVANDGRPKLRKLQPEKIGFSSVIARHGAVSDEAKAVENAINKERDTQLNMDSLLFDIRTQTIAQKYQGFHAGDRLDLYSGPSEELFIKAAWVVVKEKQVSVDMLQDRFDIDYRMANLLIGQLERMEIISAVSEGHRRVLATPDKLAMFHQTSAVSEAAAGMEQ